MQRVNIINVTDKGELIMSNEVEKENSTVEENSARETQNYTYSDYVKLIEIENKAIADFDNQIEKVAKDIEDLELQIDLEETKKLNEIKAKYEQAIALKRSKETELEGLTQEANRKRAYLEELKSDSGEASISNNGVYPISVEKTETKKEEAITIGEISFSVEEGATFNYQEVTRIIKALKDISRDGSRQFIDENIDYLDNNSKQRIIKELDLDPIEDKLAFLDDV